MNRFTATSVVLFLCLANTLAHSAEPDTSNLPFVLRNAEAPELPELQIFAKQFCTEMRKLHGDKRANSLRKFFDPRYLKKHGLTDGDLSVDTAAIEPIYQIQVADDMKTILCVVGTKKGPQDGEATKEAILLRTSVYEGKLYLAPLKAPDPKTDAFAPWILRTQL